MSKTDWPALFPAGMHEMTIDQLEAAALSDGLASHRRIELFARLTVFLNTIKSIGCHAHVWIDGSFTTTKPDPSDIDLALFLHEESLQNLTPEQESALDALFDKPTTLERFGLDIYVELYGEYHRAAYWRGVFGFCHDLVTPKGIAVLECAP